MEKIKVIKNSLGSKYFQKVSQHLTVVLYFLFGFLILRHFAGKGELLSVYLLTFLVWGGSNIFTPTKEKYITIIGLILLFCIPFLMILKIDHLVIEDFTIYVFEILTLSVIQETLSFFEIRKFIINVGRKFSFFISRFF